MVVQGRKKDLVATTKLVPNRRLKLVFWKEFDIGGLYRAHDIETLLTIARTAAGQYECISSSFSGFLAYCDCLEFQGNINLLRTGQLTNPTKTIHSLITTRLSVFLALSNRKHSHAFVTQNRTRAIAALPCLRLFCSQCSYIRRLLLVIERSHRVQHISIPKLWSLSTDLCGRWQSSRSGLNEWQ